MDQEKSTASSRSTAVLLSNPDLYVLEQKYDGHPRRSYDRTAQTDIFALTGTVRQRTRLARVLATLAIQSDRYVDDPEFKQAVDAVLDFAL